MINSVETIALLGKALLYMATAGLIVAGVLNLVSVGRPSHAVSLGRWSYRTHLFAWLMASAAMALMIGLFLGDVFGFAYVADRSNRSMPVIYKITALWAGQEGSLLLWLWMQAGYGLIVARRAARSLVTRPLDQAAAGVLGLISAFFAVLVTFVVHPFALRLPAPADGVGMNPILQSYWMATHPIMLYLGYVGLSVPFAYAVASLMTSEGAWIKLTRRWSLIAWTFLSVGILYGARWAYEELGWGGYWGWDPVENASFMPWLVATAFIHSGIIEEKRGMLKRWNHVLVFATYLLTVFGTFITRSGILSSVHAFVESDISPWFIGYMGAVTFAFLYYFIVRWDALQDDRPIVSPLSKESAFLANNVVFMATMFAIFWGTVFPLVAAAMGRQVTVGTPYFNRVTGPLFFVIIILMGVGPLISWRRATGSKLKEQFTAPVINAAFMVVWLLVVGVREMVILLTTPAVVFVLTTIVMEFVKGVGVRRRSRKEPWWLALYRLMNRSPGRYGGYVVHLGVLFIVLGIAFSQVYQEERNVVLAVGEQTEIGPFSLTLFGTEDADHAGIPAVEATLLVRDQQGNALGYLRPSKRFYQGVDAALGPTSESAIYGTWRGDLYAVLAGWEPFGTLVGFKLYYNPMVWFLWAGGGLLVFGGVFSFWPRKSTYSVAENAAVALVEIDDDFKMGKIDESEYQAVVGELSSGAKRYLKRETEAASRVLTELKKNLGLLLLIILTAASVSLMSTQGVHAQSIELAASSETSAEPAASSVSDAGTGSTSVPDIETVSPSVMGVNVVIPQDTMVLQWDNGFLSVLNLVNVTHIGEEVVDAVHLPVPQGAIMTQFEPETLEFVDGHMVDRTPVSPGEERRYMLQYRVRVSTWPFGLSREVVYPTADLTVMSVPEDFVVSGVDLIPTGVQEIAGQRFTLHTGAWLEPGVLWQATIKPGERLSAVGGWDRTYGELPLLAELDRFPGDWIIQRAMKNPAVSAVVLGLAVALGVIARRRAQAFSQSQRSDASKQELLEGLIRSVARLDLAYEAGGMTTRAYRYRRHKLMTQLAKLGRGVDFKRLEKDLASGVAEEEGHVS